MENKQEKTRLTKSDNMSKMIAFLLVLVVIAAIGFNIYKVKTHKVYNQINYQQQINLKDMQVICNKIYYQDGEIKSDFNVKIEKENGSTNNDYLTHDELKQQTVDEPIYYQVGYADEETANSNGVPMGSQWKTLNQQIVSDGYLKIGRNTLIGSDLAPTFKDHTYIFIAFFDSFSDKKQVNRNNIEPTDIPTTIVQIPLKDVLEYVDVTNFLNEWQSLKNTNIDEYNKQVEWITKNEFSPQLVKTYLLKDKNKSSDLTDALQKYSSNLSKDYSNFSELFNEVLIKYNQFLLNTTNSLSRNDISNFVLIANLNQLEIEKNIAFYQYLTNELLSINAGAESAYKQLVQKEEVDKENYKQYQTYKSIKDTLTIQQKYFMLMSIYE